METVDVIMKVPRESKEIVDALDAVLEKVMSKAPIAEYATLFGELSKAVDGINKLGEEAKSDGRDEIAGYLVQKLMSRLLPVKADEPAE